MWQSSFKDEINKVAITGEEWKGDEKRKAKETFLKLKLFLQKKKKTFYTVNPEGKVVRMSLKNMLKHPNLRTAKSFVIGGAIALPITMAIDTSGKRWRERRRMKK